jgi:hypothetical protein
MLPKTGEHDCQAIEVERVLTNKLGSILVHSLFLLLVLPSNNAELIQLSIG